MNLSSISTSLPMRQRILSRRQAAANSTPTTAHPANFAASLPEALPCPDYYIRFPHRVGAVGNVFLTSMEELEPWLLVARPVSRAEAETHGGCIIYAPYSLSKGKSQCADVRYYCITDSDDAVYGRAEYILLTEPLDSANAVAREEAEEESAFVNAFDDGDCNGSEDAETSFARCSNRKASCRCPTGLCSCAAKDKKRMCCGDG